MNICYFDAWSGISGDMTVGRSRGCRCACRSDTGGPKFSEHGGGVRLRAHDVSKTGSNQLHGSVGASAGGPVVKDRTFFFVSYEGLVQGAAFTQIGFVPSDAFRAKRSAASLFAQGNRGIDARRTPGWNCRRGECDRQKYSERPGEADEVGAGDPA